MTSMTATTRTRIKTRKQKIFALNILQRAAQVKTGRKLPEERSNKVMENIKKKKYPKPADPP